MKVISKIISIILLTIILITLSGCNQDTEISTEISKNAEIYNYQRFMNTDWGMSPQEALKALNVSEEDCKILEQPPGFPDIAYKFDYYIDQNKVKVNLYFVEIDSYSGLALVTIDSDENDSLKYEELEKMYPPTKCEATFMSLPDGDLKNKVYKFVEDNLGKKFYGFEMQLEQSHLSEIDIFWPKGEGISMVHVNFYGVFAMILNSIEKEMK